MDHGSLLDKVRGLWHNAVVSKKETGGTGMQTTTDTGSIQKYAVVDAIDTIDIHRVGCRHARTSRDFRVVGVVKVQAGDSVMDSVREAAAPQIPLSRFRVMGCASRSR